MPNIEDNKIIDALIQDKRFVVTVKNWSLNHPDGKLTKLKDFDIKEDAIAFANKVKNDISLGDGIIMIFDAVLPVDKFIWGRVTAGWIETANKEQRKRSERLAREENELLNKLYRQKKK